LLVLAGADFAQRSRQRGDFALIASLDEQPPPRRQRAWIAIVAMLSVVVLAVTEVVSLLEASVGAAVAVVALRVVDPLEARRAVNLDVVLTIALSISLGTAVESSGLAAQLAATLGRLGEPFGVVGVVAALLVATMVLTELVSNNAAAAVMLPVAASLAVERALDLRTLAIVVLIGASCSFLTPIGYQTNLMVYGLGGYRFTDFTRLGAPLTLVVAAVTVALVPLVLPLH
jgi:di/tricarboxylate transporter